MLQVLRFISSFTDPFATIISDYTLGSSHHSLHSDWSPGLQFVQIFHLLRFWEVLWVSENIMFHHGLLLSRMAEARFVLKGTRFKAFFAELKIAGRVANWKGMYARPTIPVNSSPSWSMMSIAHLTLGSGFLTMSSHCSVLKSAGAISALL